MDHGQGHTGLGGSCTVMKFTHKQIIPDQKRFFERGRRNGKGLHEISVDQSRSNDGKQYTADPFSRRTPWHQTSLFDVGQRLGVIDVKQVKT